jgi:tetratricopeptide (TPR) repeat protein
LDLDLLIERTDDARYRARVLESPAGNGQVVTFARPFSELELENFVLKLGLSRVRTRRVEAGPSLAAKQFGGRLFEAVFSGPVGECLRRSLDAASAADATLRIRLRLAECPELVDLPWELLYDSRDNSFLALSGATPVIRYVELPEQPRDVEVKLPLRILLIRSEPSDCEPLDLDAEWAQVARALRGLEDVGALAVTELASPTLGELRRVLLRDTFHVLHYMGHGVFDPEDGGTLVFTDEHGRADHITGERLGVILRDYKSLRLAVFNACEAGRTDPTDPFGGVADTLVRWGIPAVVAMQFEISDRAAIEFAPALYGALVAGRPIDAAVAEARKAIYATHSMEWATPVLHLRANDAHLFDLAQHTAAADEAAVRADTGDGLSSARRYGEAEATYRAAIGHDPGLARAHAGRGWALAGLGRYAEARDACRTAIVLDPGSASAHLRLAVALYGLRDYAAAQDACQEAIRLDPADARAHYGLGVALLGMHRHAESQEACREALRLRPDNAALREDLDLLLRQGRG